MKSPCQTFSMIALQYCAVAICGLLPGVAQDNPMSRKAPTVQEAKVFIEDAESRLLTLSVEAQRAEWVKSTYITDDTELLAAKADERAIAATVRLAKEST